MNKTPYDKGIEKGLEAGLEKGKIEGKIEALRSVTIALLESKFQSVPEPIIRGIDLYTPEQLQALTLRISNAQSLTELFPNS